MGIHDLNIQTIKNKIETVDIPISAAKKIAIDFGYEQVIIIARKTGVGGREHCTTYGINKKHCDVAAKVGGYLKYEIMKWSNPKE